MALGVLLIGGAFLLGRATKDESPASESTREASTDGAPEYDPRKSTVDYDANDVVNVFPPMIVRDGEILEQQKGTPERALLEWWQAYQFSDVEDVKSLTSQDTIDAIGDDELTQLVELPGPGIGGIEVLGSSEDGDSASIEAGLLVFTPEKPGEPPSAEPTSSTPQTFAMQKEGGEWRFAATEFLVPKLSSLEG